jgi:acyl dehydratase
VAAEVYLAAGERYYLEDMRVGQRFRSGAHLLDAQQIKDFAIQFDPQPFHLDEGAAKATFFGALVASGWHTAAITMRLLVDGGAPIAGGVIGRNIEIKWPRPTRAGDVLSVESEIIEVLPSPSHPNRGVIVVRTETRNQRGEIVQIMTSKLQVMRRLDADLEREEPNVSLS